MNEHINTKKRALIQQLIAIYGPEVDYSQAVEAVEMDKVLLRAGARRRSWFKLPFTRREFHRAKRNALLRAVAS